MENIVLDNEKTINKILTDIVEPLIGDTPVSMQIASALNYTANKEDVNALSAELKVLRREVEKLIELVGDTPVSEQIAVAINRQA